MSNLNNSENEHKHSTLKAVFYFAVFLIMLGLGNIIFASGRIDLYNQVLLKLNALKNNALEIDSNSEQPDQELSSTKLSDITPSGRNNQEDERISLRIKRAKARLDFYKFVNLGGKCLLVISAFLILYCFYYSKDFESGRT